MKIYETTKTIRGVTYRYQIVITDDGRRTTRCLGRVEQETNPADLGPLFVHGLQEQGDTNIAVTPETALSEALERSESPISARLGLPSVFYAVYRDGRALEPFLREWVGKAADRLGVERVDIIVLHLDDLRSLGVEITVERDGRLTWHRARWGGLELVALERRTRVGICQPVQPGVIWLGGR